MPETISVQDLIRREAKTAGIPEALALAIAEQESGFNPTVEGPEINVGGKRVRARGTFQLLPSTAQMLKVDPNDPVQNIRGGVTYLRQLLNRHDGDLNKVLAEYGGVKTNTTYVPGVVGRISKFRTPQGRTPLTSTQMPPEALGIAPPTLPSGRVQPPAIGAPPPIADPTFSERHPFVSAMASGMDPRTPTGRRNWMGGAGAAVGTAVVIGSAPVSMPLLGLAVATGGVFGAATGGLYSELGEQVVGTKPPSTTAILGAGAEQGFYEIVGQTGGMAIKGGVKRIASTVAGKRALDAFRAAVAVRPSAEAASEAVYRVVRRGSRTEAEGAAHLAKSQIGQRVEEAAASGPPVDITNLKTEARRILEKLQLPETTFPRAAEQVDSVTAARLADLQTLTDKTTKLPAPRTPAQQAGAAELQTQLAKAQELQAQEILKHPAMGVINRILNAEDTVPFKDAHLWKSQLQKSIENTYDKAQKSEVASITEHLAGNLRKSLADHAPYNAATEEYAQVADLFYRGYVPQLKAIAREEPAALIGMINGKSPRAARRLRDVLTTRAEEGGGEAGAAQGQAAWDGVRQVWTREKLIKGQRGLAGLEEAIEKLDPDFVKAFYGDAYGQGLLQNAQSIVAAYKASPLVRPGAEQVVPDLLRGGFLGPGSIWGALSIVRLLKGPSGAELAAWAATDPVRTRAFMRAITGPEIAIGSAALIRMLPPALLGGKGLLEMVGTPPPRAQGAGPNARRDTGGRVGAPPPQ